MKRFLFAPIVIFLWVILTPSSIVAQTSGVKIMTDGIETDWPTSLLEKDTLNNIEKAFYVSEGKLNILIEIKDPFVQNKMLNAGMEIDFDLEGKEKPQQAIQFPLSRMAELFSSGSPMGDMESMRLMGLLQAKRFNLKKFSKGNGQYQLGEDNAPGIQIGMSMNEKGILVYELSMPLASLQPKKETIDLSSFGVNILINGIQPPTQGPSYNASIPSGGRGGRGGAPSGGSGVPAGGGGRSGPGGGVRFGANDRGIMMKKMSETTHAWTTVVVR